MYYRHQIYRLSFLHIVMPSLQDDLDRIEVMTDPVKVKDKRSSRRGYITRLDSQVTGLLADIRLGELKRKLKEKIDLSHSMRVSRRNTNHCSDGLNWMP